MDESTIKLARRAVACKAWRWMPGMRYREKWPTEDEAIWGRWSSEDEDDTGYTVCKTTKVEADGVHLPDLTDPATIGCLLKMVREAHRDPQINTHADLVDSLNQFSWQVCSYDCDYTGWCDTEAEALVCALEAAR